MMIFFDNSYFDLSFKARLGRQLRWNSMGKVKKSFFDFIYKIEVGFFRLKRKLNLFGRIPKTQIQEWTRAESLNINRGLCKKNAHGEDLTISGYIDKYGGIKSVIDEKVYTTQASYMDHVKASGKTIKDW